ncbi:MAG: SGNH/GDSL hydrolase family protein [Bacteroidaceae bacterium]
MRTITFIIAIVAATIYSAAQSVNIHQGNSSVGFNVSDIDSIIFSNNNATDNEYKGNGNVLAVDGHWLSLGTSISWYNSNVSSAFTKGYQTRVMEQIKFSKFTNNGANASCLSSAKDYVINADYYTIEHGINDWGNSIPVGTFEDYLNNTKNGTFAASYRELIDKIYSTNPKAMIVLCTPRKAYGFGTYLPAHWYDAKNGIYLEDYVKIIRQIAEYESLPVADFFRYGGGQRNLDKLSIDVALHPNDNGYQIMANILVDAFKTVLLP